MKLRNQSCQLILGHYSLSLAFKVQIGRYLVSQRVETIISASRDAGLNE